MKMMNVKVATVDAELDFSVVNTSTGKQLFDQVVKTIGLREVWYFGLEYQHKEDYTSWLNMEKKIVKQHVKQDVNGNLNFRFRAKLFPERVDELIQDFTVRLFYMQIKESILKNEIFCQPDFAVMLASYIMQVKNGDYDDKHEHGGFLITDRVLPKNLLTEFKMGTDEWEKRILDCWGDHKGITREQAMVDFLRIAHDLDQCGVSYFEIRNKKGTELVFGVDCLGMNVYEKQDLLNPKIGFPWSEVKNISFSGKKFVIKYIVTAENDKINEFIFFVGHKKINTKILDLCVGNHDLNLKRRRPETLEVQQMKLQAMEERKKRVQDHERLKFEKLAREKAEAKQRETEAYLKRMQDEVDRKTLEIHNQQEKICALEQQLSELRMAKRTLEKKERELIELNTQLKSEHKMSQEEKSRLVNEIAARESQLIKMRHEIEEKTKHVEKSRNELHTKGNVELHTKGNVHMFRGVLGIPQTIREVDDENSIASGSDDFDDSHAYVEMSAEDDAFVTANQPELERVLNTNANLAMKSKLDKLHKDLDQVKDNAKVSNLYTIHSRNRRESRDRYKTLTVIRTGNTARRIEQFEKM